MGDAGAGGCSLLNLPLETCSYSLYADPGGPFKDVYFDCLDNGGGRIDLGELVRAAQCEESGRGDCPWKSWKDYADE